MYWVDRQALKNVLRNPFNSQELIKEGIADKIFKEINERYHDDFDNEWTNVSIPLNYFVNEYVKTTGMNRKELTESFVNYFEKGVKK